MAESYVTLSEAAELEGIKYKTSVSVKLIVRNYSEGDTESP